MNHMLEHFIARSEKLEGEIKRLKEINADLLDAATHCCLLACECDGWCHSMLSPVKEGKCDLLEREGCYIWDAIQKARECQIS